MPDDNPLPTFAQVTNWVGSCPDAWMYDTADESNGVVIPDTEPPRYAACYSRDRQE